MGRHIMTERAWLALCWMLVLFSLSWLGIQLLAASGLTVPPAPPGQPGSPLVDFDAFYIVGQLTAEGRGTDAYDLAMMTAIQSGQMGQVGVMPWTYLPPYHLLALALTALPRDAAMLAFVVLTASMYLGVVALLAGRLFPVVVLALIPAAAICVSLGQNGFLIGTLVGLTCWLVLRGSGSGTAPGWPLGLLVLKPHLGIGLGLFMLATGRWRGLLGATGTALALCVVATSVLGAGIWWAFVDALGTTSGLLDAGGYPLYRMLSIHALVWTSGLGATWAWAAQTLVALAACGGLVWFLRQVPPRRHGLAAACFVPALISPYFYDYDMLAAGIGLALLMPEIAARSRPSEQILLVLLSWLASGWGFLTFLRAVDLDPAERFAQIWTAPAIGAAAYLLLLVAIWRILARSGPRVAAA
jgi:hypothetical protein